ncbi:tannase/feruloyl esterase family alpha/beta hydrolase [Altererythrobacter sp. KTW20L]|uniref:tannase/feruloyl esterase family alpha/beta hydrolase n=1 Tax=Altererythrobacter sp. KTW20L TaxID=2942210 RepID=UPI0020BEE865|nr:tannase/feruloyl esterase family alpha/beta hydrolase [Altererythrobacter sp. KTW20L]MCL6251607.1 tannase/feruloyl esterase family alpha/beta hydrolase [Altererythrobacter sp. KTW20L]
MNPAYKGALSGAAVLACGASLLAMAQGPSTPAPVADPAAQCASMAQLVRPGVEVIRAELVPTGPAPAPPGASPAILPEHCLVSGAIDRRIGAGGREFAIGFELRLPAEWNGRFLFQGGGGLDGVVQAAVGNIANSSGRPALARGFAVVSTDSGHAGSIVDATFGLDQQARTDYAYNALDKVTDEAKRLVSVFYGTAPDYSYFVGCSNGGRQALVASQRLPLEYDGIVAGDPAMSFSRLALGQVWSMSVVARIAPRDADGRPVYSRAFTDTDLQLVRSAVLDQCDALDGLADGMINDWQGCSFHPRQLQCSAAKTDSCLSEGQVGVLDDLMQGPRTAGGQHIYGPFTFDTGIASSAWRGMRLGTSETGQPNSADSSLGLGQFRYLQLTPPDPDWDPLAPYDLDDMLDRIRHQGGMGDGDSPFLSTFVLGGKMIVYNGMSDQGMATPHIARWYEDMLEATGPGAAEAVKLFTVPGMLHCNGGEATDRFEMLDAIVGWVERGEAPERIVATGAAMPGMSRPLCPYPAVARYTGGDPADAASFSCRV